MYSKFQRTRGKLSDHKKKFRRDLNKLDFNKKTGKLFIIDNENSKTINFLKDNIKIINGKPYFTERVLDKYSIYKNDVKIFIILNTTPNIKQEINPIKQIKSDTYIPSNPIMKNTSNKIYAKLIKNVMLNDHDPNNIFIHLDSESVITSKHLIEIGVKSAQIFIPNFCKNTVDIIKSTNLAITEHITLNNFLIKNTKFSGRVKAAWFDYCGSFKGDKINSHPKSEIKYYFEQKFPKDNSIFGITCMLDRRTGGENNYLDKSINYPEMKSSEILLDRINQYVRQCACDNGFDIKFNENNIYGKFVTQFYTINKIIN